jgi:hypothetical protein
MELARMETTHNWMKKWHPNKVVKIATSLFCMWGLFTRENMQHKIVVMPQFNLPYMIRALFNHSISSFGVSEHWPFEKWVPNFLLVLESSSIEEHLKLGIKLLTSFREFKHWGAFETGCQTFD